MVLRWVAFAERDRKEKSFSRRRKARQGIDA